MKTTGGKNRKQMGWTAHRVLDDAKAERLWLTSLPEFSGMFFGAEKVKCSISLQAFTSNIRSTVRSRRAWLRHRKEHVKGREAC